MIVRTTIFYLIHTLLNACIDKVFWEAMYRKRDRNSTVWKSNLV